jgi:hypothetical protein
MFSLYEDQKKVVIVFNPRIKRNKQIKSYAGFDVLTEMGIKSTVFWI